MNRVVLCVLGAVVGGVSMHIARPPAATDPAKSPQPIVDHETSARRFDPQPVGPRTEGADSIAAVQDTVDQVARDDNGRAAAADAIVRLADTDPRSAMDRALAIEGYWLRLDTAERVAAVWAGQAPNAVLAFVEASGDLDPEARSALRSRVLVAWAAADPGRALGYLLSPAGQRLFFFDRDRAGGFARDVAIRQPYEMLAAADALPRGIVRRELRDAAIVSLVEQDLAFAARQAALAAPGPDRRQWLTALHDTHPDQSVELGLCELDPRIDPGCRE